MENQGTRRPSEEPGRAAGSAGDPGPQGWWARLSRSPLRAAGGAGIGAAAGVAYALTIGCGTGQCALTSSPLNAGLFGALVGAVMGWPQRDGSSH